MSYPGWLYRLEEQRGSVYFFFIGDWLYKNAGQAPPAAAPAVAGATALGYATDPASGAALTGYSLANAGYVMSLIATCLPPSPTPTPTPKPPTPKPQPQCIQVEICNWPTVPTPTPTPPKPPKAPPPAGTPPPAFFIQGGAPAPLPEACQGWTFPLGDARVGSERWCEIADAVIATVAQWGRKILDFLISVAEKIEKYGWDSAQATKAAIDEIKKDMDYTPSGIFDGIVYGVRSFVDTLGLLWEYLKKTAAYVVYGLGYGAKALLCMVGAGQNSGDVISYPLMAEVWVIRWTWKTLKNLRLSSPDFLGFQIVPKDFVDYFDRILEHITSMVEQKEIPSEADAMEAYLNNRISEKMFSCWMQINDTNANVWKPVLDSRREQLTTDEQIEYIRRQNLGRFGKSEQEAGLTRAELDQEKTWQDDAVKALRNVGWLYQEDAAPREALFDELPSISEHLHWLARNIDDQEYVAKYHLLDGFDDAIVVAGMLGEWAALYPPEPMARNFWREFGGELRAQGMRKVDAARSYAAHWIHAAPGQMREFAWRLRPGRPLKDWEAEIAALLGQPVAPGLPAPPKMVFTTDDFRRLLTEQDYGYYDVGWFLSTLYHVPALSYIRDMYRYNIIDDKQLQGYHLDLGYSEPDSERFVGVDRFIKARIRSSEAHAWTPSALARALGLGLINADFDREQMQLMGFSAQETASHQSRATALVQERVLTRALSRVVSRTITQVSTSYGTGLLTADGAVGALVNLGVKKEQAQAMLVIEAMKFNTGLLKSTISKVKQQFNKGRINAAIAAELLKTGGMQQPFIDMTVNNWNLTLSVSQKEVSAADVKRLLQEGIIDSEEAAVRLANLGYGSTDVELLLADVAYKLRQAEEKAREAELKHEQQAEKQALSAQQKATADEERELARQQALAERQAAAAQRAAQQLARQAAQAARQAQLAAEKKHKEALALMMRKASPTNLAKWLKMGLVSLDMVRAHLVSYGWDQPYIDDFLKGQLKVTTLPGVP